MSLPSTLPAVIDEVASKVKHAFSREQMLLPRNDDASRFLSLGAALGVDSDIPPTITNNTNTSTTRRSSLLPAASPSSMTLGSNSVAAGRNHLGVTNDDGVRGGGGGGGVGDDDSTASISTMPRSRLANAAIKEQVWALMNDPSSSRAAQLIAIAVMVLIVVSCSAFVAQTLPEYTNSTSLAWNGIEWFCVAGFTLELGARYWSCPDRVAFLLSPLNLIDILAVAPFYVELFLTASDSGSTMLRTLRLVRVFRIFKLSRYLPWVRVFSNALALSTEPLLMLLVVVLIAMVIFSSAMYYAERGEWSEVTNAWMRTNQYTGDISPSPYSSIPQSFWWCIVTLTTVGYGDVVPVTTWGRLIAACTALSGILVIAIPVSVISTNFNSEFIKLQRQRESVKARMLLLKKHFRERTTGLDAVLDEAEDIVTRNSQEFAGELNALFDASRLELTEEIQEVLRMAFERRRQLHVAALAAGHVRAAGSDEAAAAADAAAVKGLSDALARAAKAASASSSSRNYTTTVATTAASTDNAADAADAADPFQQRGVARSVQRI